jgi:hypothetical protein
MTVATAGTHDQSVFGSLGSYGEDSCMLNHLNLLQASVHSQDESFADNNCSIYSSVEHDRRMHQQSCTQMEHLLEDFDAIYSYC